MASEAKISVKFFVDKEENKVVFAEASKDFLDILFSFLTLPLSTVIELIGDSLVLESMSNVYKSVKSLEDKYLETKACKNMLLHPLSAGAFRCEDLKLNIGNANPRRFYQCSNKDCTNREKVFISLVPDVRCSYCEKSMEDTNSSRKRKEDSASDDDGGVFVKGGETTLFIIMDDLRVMPVSVASTFTMLQKLRIRNNKKLEEMTLDLGKEEVSYLLKQSIISETPLTDTCFRKTEVFQNESRKADTSNKISIKAEARSEDEHCEEICMKLYIDRAENRMLCAEVDGEVVNLLFSFLVLPMGSVIKLLHTSSSMGCLDNLYRSVEGLVSEYIVSDECKSLLLSPKLPPFFGCSRCLLNVEEMLPLPLEGSSCERSFPSVWISCNIYVNGICSNGKYVKPVLEPLNPKKKKVNRTEKGGGYTDGWAKFILTDNLCVSPLSLSSILQAISDCQGTFSKILDQREVVIGKVQALELLKSALISKTPLTDVFLPRAGEMKDD
ncbi:uncharacterized protein M6B38_202345 [Iris pallida]|uniref:DUF674 family protein n=1 Tax=Iris pallida TaxID=29817 RepID=A0AAX6E9Z7_IRIPA|nr:uncharacterized protein M6B38_202345 [Iris pallida]